MKKLMIAAVAVLALASCKKDYTCECTATFEGQSQTGTIDYKDVKKKDAKNSCKAKETEASQEGVTAKCSLK